MRRSQEIRRQTGGGATEEIPTATGHEDFLQNTSTKANLVLELMTIQFEENSSYSHAFARIAVSFIATKIFLLKFFGK